jgi:CNT family concentrative nucleoside transporter
MGVSGQALLTSCIMSIPCSLAVSKMRIPETDVPITANEVRVPPSDEKASSALHAASSGAATGINIALLICANLITLLALLYAVNAGLTWLGNFLNIHELTLQLITGYIFVPVSYIYNHGIPRKKGNMSFLIMNDFFLLFIFRFHG